MAGSERTEKYLEIESRDVMWDGVGQGELEVHVL